MAASREGTEGWHTWCKSHAVSNSKGGEFSFTEGSRRTGGLNKVEKAEGQQTWMWVPVDAFDLYKLWRWIYLD